MADDGYRPEWDRDLARGAQGELFFDDIVNQLAARSAEIEVKRDAWFPISNRLFVELECLRRGQWLPSGLETTKAKYWVFVFGPHPGMLVVSVEWLRQAVALASCDERNRNRPGGENGTHPTRGVYVYLNHLLQTRNKALDEHEQRRLLK